MRSRRTWVGAGLLVASLLAGCQAPTTSPSAADPDDCPDPVKDTDFSTEEFDWRLTLSPDGQTAFWAVSEQFFPTSRKARIVTAHNDNGAWSAPQDAPFSGPAYSDIDPVIAPDGQTLFFSSIRPVDGQDRRDLDLWYVTRVGDGWSEPVNLGEQVNSPRDELYPSVARDGTLYFGSDRDGGQWDIYRSRRAPDGTYGPAQRLPEPLNTPRVWEFNPEISPDGQTLVFTILSGPDGLGAGDIYLARSEGDTFTDPINLGECVNSSGDEYHPTVVWDPQPILYYVRGGDFYRANLPQP